MRNVRSTSPEPTFTLFRKLPTKVRKKIWEYALPGPQVILIFDQEFLDSDDGLYKRRGAAKYRIPALLHCNRESRRVAENYYVRAFDSLLDGYPIYIKYETDLLLFKTPWALLHMAGFLKRCDELQVCQFFRHVRYVGISNMTYLFNTVLHLLRRFRTINTLIFKDISAKTQEELDNFFTPLTTLRGAYEHMDDKVGKVAEGRAGLVGNRKYRPFTKAEAVKDALLIILTEATLDTIAKDWEKNFGMEMDEEQWKEWHDKYQP